MREDEKIRGVNAEFEALRGTIKDLAKSSDARREDLPTMVGAVETRIAAIQSVVRAVGRESATLRDQMEKIQRENWELKAKRAEATARWKATEELLDEIQESPVWKAAKPIWKLARHARRSDAAVRPPNDLLFAIEAPLRWKTSRNIVVIKGWCLSARGHEVAGVRAKVGGKSVLARYGIPRPDVAESMKHWPAAQTAGFSIQTEVPEGASTIRLEAIKQGRDWEAFFEQELSREGPVISQEIPLPPEHLMNAVAGHENDAEFARSRLNGPKQMLQDLGNAGIDAGRLRDILDFGCGCGRFLAGWVMLRSGMSLHGCDHNPELVDWCNSHIPGATVRENHLGEPLPYDNQCFDFIYLLSVFTHLTIPEQESLVSEFRRVLRKGGYVYVTFHGEHFHRDMFRQLEGGAEVFQRTGYLVHRATQEGSNDCWALHSPEKLRELFAGFAPIKHFKSTERGPTDVASWQDTMIFQAQ